MPKATTTTLSIFSTSVDAWKQEDAYGFTYAGKDYGVGSCGATQDRVRQIAEAFYRRVGDVLGKTPAEREASKGEVASVIEAWMPGATNTTDEAAPTLTDAVKDAIAAGITDGTIPIVLNGYQLTIAEGGSVGTTEI